MGFCRPTLRQFIILVARLQVWRYRDSQIDPCGGLFISISAPIRASINGPIAWTIKPRWVLKAELSTNHKTQTGA
jgi:hypothetical protein